MRKWDDAGDVGPVKKAEEAAPDGEEEVVQVEVAASSGKYVPEEVLVQDLDDKRSAKTEGPKRLVPLPASQVFITSWLGQR